MVGLTEAKAVAAGEAHSLAAKVGSVEAWGENEEGELGNATTVESDVPVKVSGLGEVSAIAAGGRTSMALLPDGTMRAWGANFYGQLGDGTKVERLKPVLVCGMTGVLSIATRGGHTLAAAANAPSCPAVTSVSPAIGSSLGGTAVTITGTNLAAVTEVHFGNAKATSFKVESPTTITATSPPGSGTVDITVTSPVGTSATTTADHFTYMAAPAVTKVVPNSGPAAGGTPVTITGSAFTEATEVRFGTTPAASFKVESATTITAVSPVHAAGTVDVTVTTAFGTSPAKTEDHFTFLQLEPPEFGRCIKVGIGMGAYAGSNCTTTGGERKYEWFPAFGSKPLVKKHFVEAIKPLTEASLTPLEGLLLTCTGQTAQGEYVSAKALGGVTMTFTGCKRGGLGSCASSGAADGEVKTSTLKGELGIVKASTEAVKDKLGFDLAPASGETVMEFTCGGVPVNVTGSVIVELKANSMLLKATLKYTGTSTVQKPGRFEGGTDDVLHSTIGEGSPEASVLKLTTILTNEEKVEANSVV